ncbi:hypothetical protein V9L05_23390 (plasmid) [Bernardetia sp. Wsw4-3y2]|uniref:toxin-antitoxin system YwqK family antitoxin n=1 Tax=Bernardetia sp. Wsw4-3y2 TaxID=3127471 RepID=UPI0030D13633
MRKYLLTSLSFLLLFYSQNSFAQSKKENQDTTKNQEQPVPIKEYYESGKLKVEGFVKNNRYDSTFISYYENGQIEAQGSFKDCVFETNTIRIEVLGFAYCNTGNFYKNNKLIKILDGNRNGQWKYYYENGQVKADEKYICGKRIGLQLEYYYSGKLKCNTFNSIENTIKTCYYENENVESIIKYSTEYEPSTEKDSTVIKIKIIETIEYYETGELKYTSKEKNGDEDGKWFEYWKNGFVKMKEEFKNGLENGTFIDYYENGNVEWQAEMKDGEYDGKQYHCNQEGKVTKIETWKNGKLIKTEIPNQ